LTSIRFATDRDSRGISEVHSTAFPGPEGQVVASLAIKLLNEKTTPETFSLVAELDGTVVGHIAFSPVTIDANGNWTGYILAPLGVKPAYQKRRIGSQLVESGIELLTKKGVNVLFVYGDPEYYGKFGFGFQTAARYSPPCDLQYPTGWLAVALCDDGFAEPTAKISCVAALHDPALW